MHSNLATLRKELTTNLTRIFVEYTNRYLLETFIWLPIIIYTLTKNHIH